MRRRDFIKGIAGSTVAWPLAARAQQSERMQRIGVLSAVPESDPEIQSWAKGFVQGLEKLGWVNGRNLRIDTRLEMPTQRACRCWQPSWSNLALA
jgi:putative tryptophan/tyrosine transport system substrate-binding protein